MLFNNTNKSWLLPVALLISLFPTKIYAEGVSFVGTNDVHDIVAEWAMRNIRLYGSVVDENARPVAGAEVLVSWQEYAVPYPGPMRKAWVITDENGLWEFENKAMRASVREVKREGYLYDRKQQDYGGISTDDIRKNRTSATNRLVMRLHKIRDPLVLITGESDLANAGTNEPAMLRYDIYRDVLLPLPDALNLPESQFYPDIQIEVSYTGDDDRWLVVFRTPASGDGVIATNTLLFEAPAEGYHQELSQEVTYEKAFPKYVYVRSRTPSLYARFKIECSLRPESSLVSFEMVANPYGTRSLEPVLGLESKWELIEELTTESRHEINSGRRPNKEDHDARITAAILQVE